MKSTPPKTKKVISKKKVPEYTHSTDEVRAYIKEVSDDFDKKITSYIGAVTEDFQHRVSVIAEQFSGLNEKLDTHTTEISRINDKLDTHTTEISRINDKLDTHTEMIGRLMVDVEEIKVGMNEKVSRSEFNKLESRLVSLESFVFSKQAKTSKNPQ